MKKINLLFLIFILSSSIAFSQKGEGGFGFYFGYGMGKYTPGLGNIKSTMYLYDQQYGAKFNYKDNIKGPALGVRLVKGFYQMDLEWIFRHSRNESSFIEPTTNEEWKLGIKTRYNTWFWGHAIRYKNFALGAGMDIGRFKLFTKRTAIADYDGTDWSQNTIYGSKIQLSKMLAITGGWIIYFDYMPKFVGVRAYYAIPMGTEEFANDASLSFYSFKPTNAGVSLFINLSAIRK
jgi:hypothetical protein